MTWSQSLEKNLKSAKCTITITQKSKAENSRKILENREEGGEDEQKKGKRYTEIALFSVLWQIATMLASPNSQQLLLQRKMSP